jgi:hypothetical protein
MVCKVSNVFVDANTNTAALPQEVTVLGDQFITAAPRLTGIRVLLSV